MFTLSPRYFLFLLLLLPAAFSTAAGDTASFSRKKNSISGEIAGKTLLGSINYNRTLITRRNRFSSIQFGAGIPLGITGLDYIPFSFSMAEYFRLKNDRRFIGLEIGVVTGFCTRTTPRAIREQYASDPEAYGKPINYPVIIALQPSLSYLQYIGNKNWFFRVSYLSTIIGDQVNDRLIFIPAWGGFSIGKNF